MTFAEQFTEIIATEEQMRDIMGFPNPKVADKAVPHVDEFAAKFIAESPFILIASSDADGNKDVSPKGDPPGFVHVLNEKTLLIPDRPGNRRTDTFSNILQNPQIGMIFLIPGRKDTLRVNGRAMLVRDENLREKLAVAGKVPQMLIAVEVDEVMFHCPKCMVRSKLWQEEAASASDGMLEMSEAFVSQMGLEATPEEVAASLEVDARENLY